MALVWVSKIIQRVGKLVGARVSFWFGLRRFLERWKVSLVHVFQSFDGLGFCFKGVWEEKKAGCCTCFTVFMVLVWVCKAFGKVRKLVGGRV